MGHTVFSKPPSQISVDEVAGYPDELYLFNWITDEEERGKGHAGRLLKAVCEGADRTETYLVTHPDTPELQATMERYGFVVDTTRVAWEGKPFMRRIPRAFQPDYEVHNG